MLSYPLRQLRAACLAAPLAPKVLLVPRRRSGRALVAALARAGTSWVSLQVTTVVDWAAEMVDVEISRAGGRRLTTAAAWVLAGEILAAHPRDAAGGGGAAGTSAAAPLARLLSDLRHAGVDAATVAASGSPHATRLASLLAAYETHLATGGWWDEAALLRRATEVAARGGKEDRPACFILDETGLSVREEAFVRAVAPVNLRRIGRPDYGIDPPSRSACRRLADTDLIGAAPPSPRPVSRTSPSSPSSLPSSLVQGDLFLDRLLAAVVAKPSPLAPDTQDVDVEPGGRLLTSGLCRDDRTVVRLWQPIGYESEVRACLRDVIDRGLPFDAVEIVYPEGGQIYLPLLYDAVRRFDVPADFGRGVPLKMTRAGRRVRAFLEWIAHDLEGAALVDGLRSGDLLWMAADVPAEEVASWLVRGRIGKGRQAPAQALACAAAGQAPEDAAGQTEGQRRHAALGELARLTGLVPTSPEVDLPTLAHSVHSYLEAAASAADDDTGTALQCRLRRLAAVRRTRPAPPAQQARRLWRWLQDQNLCAREPGPGRLAIAPLHDAGYSGRRHLYVIGMVDLHFPSSPPQDPVFDDGQRRRWSMPLADESASADLFHLIRILGGAPEVTLSAPCLALAGGAQLHPAFPFVRAARQLQIEPQRQRPVAISGCGSDDLERLLGQRHRHAYGEAVAAAYPLASRGLRAQRARGRGVTCFDGWIGGRAVAEVLRAPPSISSPMAGPMLTAMAVCPRRGLWWEVLGRRAEEEQAPHSPSRCPAVAPCGPVAPGPLLHLAEQGLFPAVHKEGAGRPCPSCACRRICAGEGYDARHLPARRETMSRWTELVEGWAQLTSGRRDRARRVIEASLATAGLRVEEIGPEDAVDWIAAWMAS